MRPVLLVIALLVCIAASLQAAERQLEVRPADRELFEVQPRQIVSTAFRVTNKAAEPREFVAELRLPEGWQPITKDFIFELAPDKPDSRLVSFFVPQNTMAGRYEVTYLVKAREYPSVSDLYTVYVVVLPVTHFSVKVLEAPHHVIAGEPYVTAFAVINESNVTAEVTLSVDSGDNFPFTADAEALPLAPGESKTVKVSVTTKSDLREAIKHRLRLNLRLAGETKVEASTINLVDVIPRISGKGDPYHRIPMELTLRQVAEKNGGWKGGFQVELSGEGTLDEEGEQHIRFHLQGPDTLDQSRFGERDEYYVSYWTKAYALHVGDRTYSLSSLTERYLYGRGIEGSMTVDKFHVGGYYLETRWIDPEEHQAAGYLAYTFLDKQTISVNYLKKTIDEEDEKDDIVSLHAALTPLRNTDVELEYAYGIQDTDDREYGDAYLARVSGTAYRASYQLRYVHADPDYPGYYSDTDLVSTNLGVPLWKTLRLNGTFRYERSNLRDDPGESSAPVEYYAQMGLDYKFRSGTRVFLDYRYRDREDHLPASTFDYREDTVKLGASHTFGSISLYGSAEFGQTQDHVDDETASVERYSVSANFRPTDKWSLSGYLDYDSHSDFDGDKNRRLTAGINARADLLANTWAQVHGRSSVHLESDGEEEYDLELSLSHRIKSPHKFLDGHIVSLGGWYSSFDNTDREDEIAFKLEYTIPFKFPIVRKKGIGTVSGRLFDDQSRQPIADVVLRLNGSTAVTDARGRFTFPAVAPGTYFLDIERSTIGLDRVPAEELPLIVTVEGGKETTLDVGVAKAASLSGRLVIYHLGNGNGHSKNGTHTNGNGIVTPGHVGEHPPATRGGLVDSGGLSGILVEMTNGAERQRRVSGADGTFRFDELRPGTWTLTVVNDHIPEYHCVEPQSVEVTLTGGDHQEMTIKVMPVERPIKMLHEGETIVEEAPSPTPLRQASVSLRHAM